MSKFNIMKKNILVFVFLVFSFLNGQNNKKIDFNSLTVKESNNSLLFKIEKDNKINYMFGTMHLMCESEMKYKNLLNSLIKEVDVIVFESNDKEISAINPMPKGKGFLGIDIPEEYKIKNIYSENELKIYKDYLDNINIPKYIMNIIINTDIISAGLIEAAFSMLNMKCDKITGSEMYIEKIINKKEKLYLESFSEFKEILSELISFTYNSIEFSSYNVQASIKFNNQLNSDEALSKLIYHYNINDIDSYWNDFILMTEKENENLQLKVFIDGLEIYLLKERNKIWIPRMIDIMNSDKALFAVGALHLSDLAVRLEKEGYIITPLDISTIQDY